MFSQRLICLNRMKISFCIFLRPYLKKNNHLNTFYFSHHFIPFFCSSNFLVYSTSNSSAISIACCFLSPKNPYTTGVCYRNTKTTSFFISQSLRCINREFEKHDNQRHTYPIFRMRTKEKKKNVILLSTTYFHRIDRSRFVPRRIFSHLVLQYQTTMK